MRIVWPATRRVPGPGAVMGALIAGGIALGGGQALAATAAGPGAPLAGSTSATLTQVNAGEWTTTIYLDTAALCAGQNPAMNKFTLITGEPDSVTGAAAPAYPDGSLACSTAEENPVTAVKLTFAPSLSAIPQTAALTVTPPRAQLLAGDTPVQIPLTIRRTVSMWQYAGIPAICGACLIPLLVLVLMVIGMPGRPVAPANWQAGPNGQDAPEPGARAGRLPKRVRWGPEFWRTPLFAGAAWSLADSWATSVAPLTALAGGVLTASGVFAGLVPGVDLTRFGLLMALVGGLTTLASPLFGALNSLFPSRIGEPVPSGEVIAVRFWVMLLASCLTVFAVGAEIGFVGLVLGFNLIVVPPSVRWIGPVAAALAALLFLTYRAHSIVTLTGRPSGAPKSTARKSSFTI